jgi:hypothetical protein
MDDRSAGPAIKRHLMRLTPAILLILAACSRASLLGWPGPEVAHHASPAQVERLAVAEPVKTFKTKEACKARLDALAHEHGGGEVVQISEKEYRAYASKPWGEGEIHHEYSCAGKALTERSWTSKAGGADAHHTGETH